MNILKNYSNLEIYQFQNNPKAVSAIETELAKSKNELTSVNAKNGLTIISAFYGDFSSKRTIDVTTTIQKYCSSNKTIDVTNKNLGSKDPAPYTTKLLIVTYSKNGEITARVFAEDSSANFKKELN
jgi:hypothetical protein